MLIGDRRTLAFEVEPVSPGWEVRTAQEQAGWAGLAVWVRGQNLCKHVAPGTDRVLSHVFVPLGPPADWLVRAWPAIAWEERPRSLPAGRDPRETWTRWCALDPPEGSDWGGWYESRRLWWSRHFLEAGATGAVLPDLGLVRDGADLMLGWAAVSPSAAEGRRSTGCALVSWDEARRTLSEFVSTVAASFRSASLGETWPWLASPEPLPEAPSSSMDAAIALFAGRSAAELRERLGATTSEELREALALGSVDPGASVLAQLLRDLPAHLDDDLLGTAQLLAAQVEETSPGELAVEARRLGVEAARDVEPAEQQGHQAAAVLRELAGHDGQPLSDADLDSLAARCGLRMETEPAGDSARRRQNEVQSLLGAREGKGACARLLPTRRLRARWARRFETARLIGAWMLDPLRGGTLGRASSPLASERLRRRSGAFAAELLLPASGVRAHGFGTDSVIRGDQFERLMAEYGVGARAAAWQLWNTGLLSSEWLRDELIDEYAAVQV